ncbi:MAG: SixA phosphatase family protein [Streptosporangiaceae bacterium]
MREGHRLIVMRHAKAGELPGGPDFERALRPRGRRDSAAAGAWLAAAGFRPDAVICSAARRTRQTWQYVAPALGAEPEFAAERSLYEADSDDVAEIIRQTPATVPTLLYIGHNPAAAGLVALLTGSEPAFPTAAIAVIALPGQWSELAPGDGEIIASWSPRTGAAGPGA